MNPTTMRILKALLKEKIKFSIDYDYDFDIYIILKNNVKIIVPEFWTPITTYNSTEPLWVQQVMKIEKLKHILEQHNIKYKFDQNLYYK